MRTKLTVCAAAVLTIAAVTLAGCTTSVAGRPIRAAGQQPHRSTSTTATSPSKAISARDLLLHDGDDTPLGPATAAPLGDNYFTSARPPECSAALLFKGSPLRPGGYVDNADSAYRFGGSADYAESVDVYDKRLNTHDVVWNGFSAVSQCTGDAFGVSPIAEFGPMRLSLFAVAAEDVLVWTVTRPDWTCDYGLAVVTRVALLLSVCDTNLDFPMADWASTRRSQIQSRVS